jgi:hypothetical protein
MSYDFSQLTRHKEFDPKAFIKDEEISQNLCNFVLALALAYNDFKFYSYSLHDFRKAKPRGPSKKNSTWGEYNGIELHIIRLHIGFVNELFILIQQNREAISHPFLKKVVRSLPKNIQESWEQLKEAALNKKSHSDKNPLLLIRNTIIFHYDSKKLMEHYREGFFTNNDTKEKACISLGRNAMQVRFYFADKAVQEYLRKYFPHFRDLNKILINLNLALYSICVNFITSRGFSLEEST